MGQEDGHGRADRSGKHDAKNAALDPRLFFFRRDGLQSLRMLHLFSGFVVFFGGFP